MKVALISGWIAKYFVFFDGSYFLFFGVFRVVWINLEIGMPI